MRKDRTEIFICKCHSINHQLMFWRANDTDLFVTVHLTEAGFFRRLWHGIRYVLGFKAPEGDFADFIFRDEDKIELKKFLNEKFSD